MTATTRQDMETLDYTIDDGLAVIALNRPEKMNAINLKMRLELFDVLTDVRDNRAVRAAIITGRGRAFTAGHDLSEPADLGDAPTSHELFVLQSRIFKPIVAAINGICLAQGGGLALLSDIRIASSQARFGWPQVKRGITSVSGPTMFARLVPRNKAMEILLTGDLFDAQTALELSLVNRVVEPDELMPAAEETARRILANAPLAVAATKEIVVRTSAMPDEDAFRFARVMFDKLEQSEDAAEGIAAFQEKREPRWVGR